MRTDLLDISSNRVSDWDRFRSVKVIIPAGARIGLTIEQRLKEAMPWTVVSNVYGR